MVSVEHAVQLLSLARSDLGVITDERLLVSALNQAAGQSQNPGKWTDWLVIACPVAGLKCRRQTLHRDEIEEKEHRVDYDYEEDDAIYTRREDREADKNTE